MVNVNWRVKVTFFTKLALKGMIAKPFTRPQREDRTSTKSGEHYCLWNKFYFQKTWCSFFIKCESINHKICLSVARKTIATRWTLETLLVGPYHLFSSLAHSFLLLSCCSHFTQKPLYIPLFWLLIFVGVFETVCVYCLISTASNWARQL